MNFNSAQFIVFFPIVWTLNFIVPTKYRFIPLLAASYYFYMSWNAELFFLILFTTGISYFSGILTEKRPAHKKLWLVISAVSSLSVLFFFKYYNFISGGLSAVISLFGNSCDLSLELILPVGISFYTFQTLSYSIDIYRGKISAEKNFFYYALFVSFFPQLVAGPIERPENLLPQFKAEHKINKSDMAIGAKRMLAGFFKKIVVADLIAAFVNPVFSSPSDYSGGAVLVASALFAIQIYCDFSGYTDIAIGCARTMGYRLMQNFDRPYSAISIKDFWARWHISLTSWFKDYLYIPLGGNRCKKSRALTNLMIVFLVSGLWHGANYTFILWGFIHGIYRIVGILTANKRESIYEKLGINQKSSYVIFFKRAVTFLLVCFAWIFFRANSVSDLGILLSNLFFDFGGLSFFSQMGFSFNSLMIIVISLILLVIIDRSLTLPEYDSAYGAKMSAGTTLYLLWAIVFAWMILIASDGASSFIYFQF